jgi:cytochrome P450
MDLYLLTHPAAVEHVLYKHHRDFRKPDIFHKAVGLLVGKGLFTSEGDLWTRQRKLISPVFHSASLDHLVPAICQAAEQFIDHHRRQGSQTIDIDQAMMTLGLRITSTTLLSTDISGEADDVGKAFRTAFVHLGRRLNSAQLIPPWLPVPANVRFSRAKRRLDRMVKGVIDARRGNTGQQPDDLLTTLMQARDAQGRPMPDRQLMDEVLTLMTAGHENIGAALTWTWRLLASHPHIQEQVYDEVHARLQGEAPASQDLASLPLTRAVFEESMRLFPPGWGELRQSTCAQQLQGYDLPDKAIVMLCQWVTHRHPDFWQSPDQFKPERFLPGSSQSHHRFAYFPFGGGPRVCIGMQLALMEGVIVLASILEHFRILPVPGKEITPDATFTLRPRQGLQVILQTR